MLYNVLILEISIIAFCVFLFLKFWSFDVKIITDIPRIHDLITFILTLIRFVCFFIANAKKSFQSFRRNTLRQLRNINWTLYIDIFENSLLQSTKKMGLKDNYFILTQDDYPKHEVTNTRAWNVYNVLKHLKMYDPRI